MCGEINICNKTNNKDPDDDDDDGDDCVWHVTPSVQSYNPCLCLLLACLLYDCFECCACAVLRLVYLPLNTIFPSKKLFSIIKLKRKFCCCIRENGNGKESDSGRESERGRERTSANESTMTRRQRG